MTTTAAPAPLDQIAVSPPHAFPQQPLILIAGCARLVDVTGLRDGARARTVGFYAPGILPDPRILGRFIFVAHTQCRISAIGGSNDRSELFMQLAADVLARTAPRLDIRARLLVALAQIARDFGVDDSHGRLIPIPLTGQLLAELIGCTRPRISAALVELEFQGALFRPHPRHITLLKGYKPSTD